MELIEVPYYNCKEIQELVSFSLFVTLSIEYKSAYLKIMLWTHTTKAEQNNT